MTTLYKSLSASFASVSVGTDDILIVGKGLWQVSGTFNGTVRLLRSNADESNFVPCKGLDGNDVLLTAPGILAIVEPDNVAGGKYKGEMTVRNSGTAVIRITDGGERP
jgi:hypothetical protein